MNDKTISQMNTDEMREFLIESFDSVRKATKKLETFESEIKALKTKAEEAISAEMLAISRDINTEKRSINDKAKDTRELAITKQDAIDTELQNTKDHAKITKKLIDERLNKANSLLSEIEEYHGNLLTDTKDKNEKDSIKKSINDYIIEQKEQIKQLREELESKIISLLPGATVARLSNAYREAKERYGSVPDKENTGDKWFYALFIIPLGVVIFLILRGDVVGLVDIIDTNGSINPNALLNRFLIGSPFATLSWFGWSSIRLNRRLYEEYNHKQRVMQLYHGFNGEIEKYGRRGQKQKLLDIMLQNVADKPSLAVHSGKKKINQISFLWGMFVLTRGSENLPNINSDTDENDSDADDINNDSDENNSDADDTNNDSDENNNDADDSNNDADDANSGTDEGNKE